MIKICFFSLDMKIGGVERQLYYLINGLAKCKEYSIHLVLCKREGDFLKEINSNIRIHELGIDYSLKNYLIIFIKLVNIMRLIKPNILISFHGNLNFITCMIKLNLPTKIICCFPGYYYKGRLNFIRRLYLKLSDVLIAVSEGVKDSLKGNLFINLEKLFVIENSIDIDDVIDKTNKKVNNLFNHDYPVIVSLGRLDKGKGFDIFINSFQYVNNKCNYLIIGDGPFSYQLKKFAAKLSSPDRIFFVGNQENPYPYLKLADIFVLASESEGLPTAVLEAMVLRKPVICANYAGGLSGVIEHNRNGIVVPTKDPVALAFAIDELIESPKKCLALADSAFDRVKSNFSLRSYVEKYDNLFKKYEKL